ncbi:type VI secretion system membrane subunit TssM [Sphingomonas jatrophae]|uniref:Type VI secretion system protein ImpL n=1 Tax=Sphingomonas jatrophae TaxID=1166337 RepID=A0A1I6M281_9SPHN|nr:type VI secretion system membrane subunit TssM [Sphingomonas jatrophae]SFS09773.1 type VI secretion system protein ImpL [Sphingomonas jatrophae]
MIRLRRPNWSRRRPPRWALVLAGLVLLALLIWFVGPLIAIAGMVPLGRVWVRLTLIVLLFAGFAARLFWRRQRARKQNEAMVAELGTPAAPDPNEARAAGDIAAMEERAQRAMALMRDTRIGKKGEFVYELPWYIIIGPPGAGKTTALRNSGLDFPVAQELGDDPVRGLAGTRTTEWWFTDQAVLIDTAGRYTTQDSDEAADQQAWRGLLDLLRKYRPRQPVTGIIVAISVTDLTGADESAAVAHGRAVRARINEVQAAFGVRTPIYVLLTKLDLLAGFTEFFDDLPAHEREQVWGETWPVADTDGAAPGSPAALDLAFDRLVERLDARVLMRVQGEQDMVRRGLIFAFPQQFASLRQPLGHLLATITRETKYEPRPFVRGFYFTSGTQFGRPIDRLLGALSVRFGLSLASGRTEAPRGRSYFLRDLLAKVVFPESALAGRDPKAEARARLVRLGILGSVGAVALLLTGLWTLSYFRNAALIDRLDVRSAALAKQVAALPEGPVSDSDVLQVLEPLEAARALPFASTAAPDDRSPGFSWGIGRASSFRTQVDGAYRNLLNRQFLPRLLLGLEDRLTALAGEAPAEGRDNRAAIYATLRLYLMLGRAPGAPLDRSGILAAFDDDWADRLPGEDQAPARAALHRHLATLLAGPVQAPRLNATLIADARARVASLGPGERVYAQMLADPSLRNLPEWTMASVPGVGTSRLFTRRSGKSLAAGVPGMFRRRFFYQSVVPAIGRYSAQAADEGWVTGNAASGGGPLASRAGATKDALLTTYLADFTRRWDETIDDVVVSGELPMDERLRMAVRPPSPVKALFSSWADETNLTPPSLRKGRGASALRVGAIFSRSIYRGLQRADQVGSAAGSAPPGPPGPLDEVVDHFRWLREMNPATGPAPIDDALNALTAVGDTGTAARSAAGLGDPLLQRDRSASAMAATARLGQVAATMPPAAGRLFNGFVTASTAQLNRDVRAGIRSQYSAQLGPECRSILAQGFPFRASPRETTIDDFSRLFRPSGLIDAFVTANLAGQIDTTRRNWALTSSGRALGLSPQTVAQLSRAGRIRDVFFKPGDIRPNLRFLIEPLRVGGDATAITLTVDGAPAAFDRVNRRGVELRWPGNAPGVTLSVQRSGSATPSIRQWSGDWALFRFLRSYPVSNVTNSGLVVTVAEGGADAAFRIRLLSGPNPFRLPELTAFQCPAGL